MKLFACDACQQIVHFDNSRCTRCGRTLGYLADCGVLTALEPVAESSGVFVALAPAAKDGRYRLCGNQIDYGACNWAVTEDDDHRLCRACRLNDVIPALSDAGAKTAWLKLELSKRHLIYTLLALGLPVEPRGERAGGLAFAFKADRPGEEKILTGHDKGVITINIAEADSASCEKTRLEMGETYRTVLGHFRHEIGHYYWDRLIAPSPLLERFRGLFGDERVPYQAAVERHYRDGAPRDWPSRFVSSYASMHPWEDWAESWAHYLHMIDTVETAQSFGLTTRPTVKVEHGQRAADELKVSARQVGFDDFDELTRTWVPLTIALNSLNRSMGLPDPYPFVLAQAAHDKIGFVHEVCRTSATSHRRPRAASGSPPK